MQNSDPCASWLAWFEDHGPKLLLCARQWTRNLQDAEDVVQDAFVRYWRHQRYLDANPLPLLLTSVRRSALDLARRQTRRVLREQKLVDPSAEASWFETPQTFDEETQGLEAALQQLPLEQREVIALKIWGELSFEQIGAQLGLSPNTVASRYRYALQALKRRLSPLPSSSVQT